MMAMLRRIRALIRKEYLELLQSPRLLVLVIVAPIVQLTLLGYAATTDISHVPIVVVDGDRSSQSRALLERFAGSPYFDVIKEEPTPSAVDADLAQGRAWLAVVIPPGLGDALAGHGRPGALQVQVLADGSDANSSGLAIAYATSVVSAYDAQLTAAAGQPPGGIDGRVRVWFNPELQSRDFMVPGVVALLLLVITANLSSMAIVRERELGTLEQLNVTPLGRWDLILSKLLAYGLIGVLDVVLVTVVAVFWFEVPLLGSFWFLLLGSLAYLLCTLGLGLFVSTISSTQQQAMMTSMFFFLLPMVYLSGFVFPIENMPAGIQWVTTLIPLRYFLVMVRGIFLKGVGWDVLWPQFAALLAWGSTVLALAAFRSSKRA
jgi:ABC-2 type transport system permease protein